MLPFLFPGRDRIVWQGRVVRRARGMAVRILAAILLGILLCRLKRFLTKAHLNVPVR
ncbi:hypothetical protein MES4922_40322 [Mesorhizobium ventifaucium]|uniref:Uncharacterized protein n=1 Tax=Mesorhizobium ventifaucium TaxID=666020 RepID=A0ABM9E8S2_9HYPH|nr:hypothetical protein MES4922_40322 [Mesorhizobium ventifaucium]